MEEIIGALRLDVDALEKLVKEIGWFVKPIVKNRILLIKNNVLEAIKKLEKKEKIECPYKKNCVRYNTNKSIEYCISNEHKKCYIYLYKEILKGEE